MKDTLTTSQVADRLYQDENAGWSWAAKIVTVCRGYMAFEFMTEYEIWRKQK